MSLWDQIGEFLSEPTTWTGPASIWSRLFEHVWISLAATALAILLALPLALWLGHIRKGSDVATAVVNIGRAIPTFGVLVLVVMLFAEIGVSFLSPWPALVALVALAAPPVFTNTIAGIHGVQPATVEAARGMGLTERQVLAGVELPLASPIIMEGCRIALVQVIATATLWALTAGGGLGRFIVDGYSTRDQGELVVGAVLVALLAIIAEFGLSAAQKRVTPEGMTATG